MPFPYKDYREWLRDEEELGEVVRIKSPIKCGDPNSLVDAVPPDVREEHMRVSNTTGASGKLMETDLKAVSCYLNTWSNSPIGIIENPINNKPDVPIIINPWSTRERVLRMCGCKDKEEFVQKYAKLSTNLIPPVKVSKKDAPCKEVVIKGDEVDLYQDVPRNWVEFETVSWSATGGGQWVNYDPETGTHNLGEWRSGFFDWEDGDPSRPMSEELRKRHMFVCLAFKGRDASDGGMYYAKLQEQNKPTPGAYVMCPDPSMVVTASARAALVWPQEKVDEYAAHGGFVGAPVELVESETIPGLMVPAYAEYVIEGEFLPNERYIVPPYAEGFFQGYLTNRNQTTVFKINCITHRKNPMWCSTWSSNSSVSGHKGIHATVLCMFSEAEAINYMRQNGYDVLDIVNYDCAFIVVQMKYDGLEKGIEHLGKTVLNTLYGCPTRYLGNMNKYFVAVGPDINPYDLRDVIWALNTRVQPVSDSMVIKNGLCPWGDPSGIRSEMNRGRATYGEQVLIDALIKVPERYNEYPPRNEPVAWERKAIKRMEEQVEFR